MEKDAIAFWVPVITIFTIIVLLGCLTCCGVIGKKCDWHNVFGCFEKKQKQKQKKKVRAFEDREDPSPLDPPRTYKQAGPFSYECKRCRTKQTITHPVYRYQMKSSEFTENDTWICEACNQYSKWRICKEDIKKIPK